MAHRDAATVSSDAPLQEAGPSRRLFLLAGLGLLVGCATESTSPGLALPDPAWPGPSASVPRPPAPVNDPAVMSGVRSRAAWAGGSPVPSLMNRMLPVRYVTIHHDGMSTFTQQDERSTAARIELIRKSHRERGWGDIGYHYIVDPAGRIWEGRQVSWQGAHVKDRNEGNIGIVCLGNFDRQTPSPAQVQALASHLQRVIKQYGIGVRNVKTHQEWAPTACPGRNLQRQIASLRSSGKLA